MKALRVIFGDQLSPTLSSLQGASKKRDLIFFYEGLDELTLVKHHQKKIAFLLSARRHFAAQLESEGHQVRYLKLDDPQNPQSMRQALKDILHSDAIEKVILTHPRGWHLL